jgi:hypothetical protein
MKTLITLLAACILSSCTYAPTNTNYYNGVVQTQPQVIRTCYTRSYVTQLPYIRLGNPYGTSGSYGGGYYHRY